MLLFFFCCCCCCCLSCQLNICNMKGKHGTGDRRRKTRVENSEGARKQQNLHHLLTYRKRIEVIKNKKRYQWRLRRVCFYQGRIQRTMNVSFKSTNMNFNEEHPLLLCCSSPFDCECCIGERAFRTTAALKKQRNFNFQPLNQACISHRAAGVARVVWCVFRSLHQFYHLNYTTTPK